jgi:hypothetical protein
MINPPDYMNLGCLSFENKLPTFLSSTLMELHINMDTLNDCLHLLDGRFNQLRVLYVYIVSIFPLPEVICNNVGYFA